MNWLVVGAWHPKPGEAVTLLEVCTYGTEVSSFSNHLGWSAASLRKSTPKADMFLRARFDPVSPDTLRKGPKFKTAVPGGNYICRAGVFVAGHRRD